MKKNTDFAGSERKIFIGKTHPRVPRDRPPLFRPVKKCPWLVSALVIVGGGTAWYLVAAVLTALFR